MRHRNHKTKLGRHRHVLRALTKTQARSLILHKKIKTTTSKAKYLRSVIEPMVTTAKKDTLANRRLLIKRLGTNDQKVLNTLFKDLGPRYQSRPGGYTRITKIGNRKGDCAEISQIEFLA